MGYTQRKADGRRSHTHELWVRPRDLVSLKKVEELMKMTPAILSEFPHAHAHIHIIKGGQGKK